MGRRRPRPARPDRSRVALLMTALAALAPGSAVGQEETEPLVRVPQGEEGWNTGRVLTLVERARDRRREPVADSSLLNYRADVRGFIYFFIDREAEPEPVLLRADQVALELYWAQPDRTKQVIRGMRSEEQFPIKDFRYYLDRYTVIQNGFDDVIRVGEGRDVRNVIHPLAPMGNGWYDFRLADSTTIRLPGQGDPLRVYEIQVRPRSFDLPAIVGSLFVERARGDLVRLAFTFTPASYLDPRNERVEVMLENALWEGRYWLPREQRLLVRREIPELDLDVGTVIRGALTVDDYTLNTDLPDGFFLGRPVVLAAGPERLAEYEFDQGLYDGFDDVGLAGAQPGTLDEVDVDAIAGRIIRQRFLRGVPRLRFFAPSISSVARYDRTEGLVLGAGASVGAGRSQLHGYAGWAFGAERPVAEVGWKPAGPDPARPWAIEAFLNRPRDIGLRPAASGVLASLAAAGLGRDLRDVQPVSGGRVSWERTTGARRWTVAVAGELHQPVGRAAATAPFDEERLYRPPVPAAGDVRLVAEVGHRRRGSLGPLSVGVRPAVTLRLASEECAHQAEELEAWWTIPCGGDAVSGRVRVDVDAAWRASSLRSGIDVRGTGAAELGTPDVQDLLYVGGRNTIPGHPLHGYAGTRAALLAVTGWHDLVPRLVRLRLLAAAGWTGPGDLDRPVPAPTLPADAEPWRPRPTDGIESSVGAGFGFLDGVIRLDWVVRTDTGEGSLLLSVDPRLWSFL